MDDAMVEQGAGVWFGTYSAKFYDLSGQLIPVSGQLGLLTNDDTTSVMVFAYRVEGTAGQLQLSGEWSPQIHAISAGPDSGYGISAEGQIKNNKTISGLLYQQVNGATIKIGKWSASKL
jgi:hypothetical protein